VPRCREKNARYWLASPHPLGNLDQESVGALVGYTCLKEDGNHAHDLDRPQT
jgi:hypothetical protein